MHSHSHTIYSNSVDIDIAWIGQVSQYMCLAHIISTKSAFDANLAKGTVRWTDSATVQFPSQFILLYQVNQSNTGLHPQLIYIYYFIGLLDHGLVRKVIIILRPTLLATISSISSTKMTLPSSGECQETVVHHQSLSVTLKVKDQSIHFHFNRSNEQIIDEKVTMICKYKMQIMSNQHIMLTLIDIKKLWTAKWLCPSTKQVQKQKCGRVGSIYTIQSLELIRQNQVTNIFRY